MVHTLRSPHTCLHTLSAKITLFLYILCYSAHVYFKVMTHLFCRWSCSLYAKQTHSNSKHILLWCTRYVYCTPVLLRLWGQVPVALYMFSKIMARKYYLYPPPLMLSTLGIHSLLQRALPSSLTGCTTFWQTQVCVCVCMCLYKVGMCVYACVRVCVLACAHANGQMGRQTCMHTWMRACVPICQAANTTICIHVLYLQV